MSFNPDPKKTAHEVLFSPNIAYPIICFNIVEVQRPNQQKHLGISLKLNFICNIDKVLTKTSKSIAFVKRLRTFLQIINYQL